MSDDIDISTWQGTRPYLKNILNEVIGGFRVDYARQLGTTRAELCFLFEKVLNIRSESMLTPQEDKLLVRVARLCDGELGIDEFFTRTGYTLEESHAIAARLERIAAEQVHAAAS